MPTYLRLPSFDRDFDRLTNSQQAAFRVAVQKLIDDLRRGKIRTGLRVKRVQRREGVWELTWADDGRATFEYGAESGPATPTSSGAASAATTSSTTHDRTSAPCLDRARPRPPPLPPPPLDHPTRRHPLPPRRPSYLVPIHDQPTDLDIGSPSVSRL